MRFDGKSNVAGYDPDRYLDMYYAAGGSDSDERIRNLRRELEAPRREEINARKRAAYARRREVTASGEHARLRTHYPNTVSLTALDAPGFVRRFEELTGNKAVDRQFMKMLWIC